VNPVGAVRGLDEAVACGPLRFHRYGLLPINGRWTVNSVPQPNRPRKCMSAIETARPAVTEEAAANTLPRRSGYWSMAPMHDEDC
jgi:hypothetical protein